MEESAGHLSGHQHCRGQGGHHFPSKTSAHPSVHRLPDQEQPSRPPAGRGRLAVEGGHREGHQRDFSRVLQPAVPGSEKDRRSSSSNQPIHFEPPHGGSPLEDGNAGIRPIRHQKSGVDSLPRHLRRISPCPDAQGCKKVSAICGQQASLPIHLSTLRIGNFTLGVHQAFTPSHSSVKTARREAAHLLRQLADPCRYSRTGPIACPDDHQCVPVSRLDHQLQEVRPNSKSGLPVHRDAVQHSTVHSGTPTEDASQSPVCSPTLDDQFKHHSPRSSQIAGHGGVYGFTGTTGRLRLRPVQWWVATAWCQRTGSWSDRITVPQWVLSEVAWWASRAVLQGLPLATRETEVALFTDASSSAWGAQLGSHSTQGQWLAFQRSCHINVLEMQAVINAVRDFLPHLRSRVVRLMCDIAVTVAYIKNKGGTQSCTLMQMTLRLMKWCDRKAITLVPVHLPGVHNIQADTLSRVGQTLNTEWTMVMERLRPVFAQWGEPQVDLFATFANRRLIKFASPYPNPRAKFTDAMSVPWDHGRGLLYAFPPFKMVPQVLNKVAQSPGVHLILIAPLQETASWFPELLDLSQEDPIPLYVDGHVFRVRSHHFSTYMMHLFRDGLLPSTIISHRTSVASVLRHWVYDPAADPHIKLHIRAFRLEHPVHRRIMPKWDLHLLLFFFALMRPPFASESDEQDETSDVIPLKWRTMKTVFLLALDSARRRSYIHALSVAPDRCVFSRGNTQLQLVVSLLLEPEFLAKNQLPSQAPEWISVLGIAHLNPSKAERMLCPIGQLKLYLRDSERIRMFIHWNRNIRDIMSSHISRWIVETVKEAYT